MKKLMLVLAVAFGFAASALSEGFQILSEDPPSEKSGDQPGGDNPPDKPSGEGGTGETPPDKPSGDGEGGGSGGGGSGDTTVLTGVLQLDSGTAVYDGGEDGAVLTSTNSDENVILVQSNACLTISNYTLNKSGDTSSEDNSNFFALNAVVAAKAGGTNCLDNCTLNSNADGANCLFASGEGSTIYAYNCTLTSTTNSSRGLDATYEGTVIASKMTINTSGDHCASLATDRGNGYISVMDATLSTAGQGSALIYSTGIIEANSVTGTSTGAQIAGIEGLSTIRIKNSDLTGSGKKASEPVANGVIIYQSNSGDSTDGTATFEVSDSTLTSKISDGAMFYITHSAAFITVQNTKLAFDTANNYLLNAAGNDGTHGWGNAGSNGAEVVFTAIDQTLAGNIAVDGISAVDLYLTNTTYTGTFEKDSTNAGDGEVNVFVSADSTWTVTSNCTLKTLTAVDGAQIKDGSGKDVPIVSTSGAELRSGTSDLKITVVTYSADDFVATNITDFAIDRSAFEAMYPSSQGQGGGSGGSGGGSGGAQDHDGWVYYFKPHPPDNAIVKVKVDGADDYGTPDRDHKYCLDGYWDGSETGVKVRLLYVTQEGYLFSDGCKSNTWDVTITNNAQEVYPPEDVVAIKAQAKSGATYYLTLKEAVDAAKARAKITLMGNITLSESLTVTNSITLNLNTNTVTLASTLTNAFLFTAGATVSNGTINASLATNVEGSAVLCFTGGNVTLSDLILIGNGCLLDLDGVKSVTLTNNCYNAPTVLRADAATATNLVATINADKAGSIAVPTGVEESLKDTYLDKVEATVTSDNRVVVGLTPAAAVAEQDLVDAVVTSATVVASLVSTNATATIATTTPGLYYWIEGCADLSADMEPGPAELSTNGGSVELSKPALDMTKGKAFFKISAGVSAPTP